MGMFHLGPLRARSLMHKSGDDDDMYQQAIPPIELVHHTPEHTILAQIAELGCWPCPEGATELCHLGLALRALESPTALAQDAAPAVVCELLACLAMY